MDGPVSLSQQIPVITFCPYAYMLHQTGSFSQPHSPLITTIHTIIDHIGGKFEFMAPISNATNVNLVQVQLSCLQLHTLYMPLEHFIF